MGARKAKIVVTLLEAAKKVLQRKGYSGLSTRGVAAEAGAPLSQIHYHFGSKQGLVLALFEYLNAQLLDRQNALLRDPSLDLSRHWKLACAYLDDDIASGYVRVLQELITVGMADKAVARIVRANLRGWIQLITELAAKAERELGTLGPFRANEMGALVASAFIGAESLYLSGFEKASTPIRPALRRVGDLISAMEMRQSRS